MSRYIPPIEVCDFYTETTRDERFIGRVEQFPKLRTRPAKTAVIAIDDIVSMTSEHLRDLHSAAAGFGPARRNA